MPSLTVLQFLTQYWYLLIYSLKKIVAGLQVQNVEIQKLNGLGEFPIELLMENGLHPDQIQNLAKPIIQDFAPFITGTYEIADLQLFFDKYGAQLFPYSVDRDSNTLILVKIKGNLKDYTTSYEGLQKTMQQVYAVPLKNMLNLMGIDYDFSRVIFLYKVGRCGSTLMLNLMDKAVGQCEGHSEPLIFMQLSYLLSEKLLDEQNCTLFLRVLTFVFLQGAQKRLSCQYPTLVLAPQGSGNLARLLLEKSIPKAKAFFMYRNPIQVVDSFLSGVIKFSPEFGFMRSTGLIQFFNPIATSPVFYFQSNYKKPQSLVIQEQCRVLVYYNEQFLEQLAQPNENLIYYAVKQYYYMSIGPNVMQAYGTLYTMHKMYNMGLLACSFLYDDFISNVQESLLQLGEVLDMRDVFSKGNIDFEMVKKLCSRNVHEVFPSGRNVDYENYDHYEGNRVKHLTKNEVKWMERTFEQFRKLTGLNDCIIDGTIFVGKRILN